MRQSKVSCAAFPNNIIGTTIATKKCRAANAGTLGDAVRRADLEPARVRPDLAAVAWSILACLPPMKIHVILPAVRMRVND